MSHNLGHKKLVEQLAAAIEREKALKEEIERLRLQPKTNETAKRYAREYVAELSKDKERLDWIKDGIKFGCEEGAAYNTDSWTVYDKDWSQPLGAGRTIRAAIDAARSAKGETP